MAEHTTEVVGELTEQIGEGAGMPQLDFATYPNQIFWLAVSLIIVFFILSRVVLPRVSSVLAERQGTITNDIAMADELKQKAVAAEEAYLKALADARAEAGRIVTEAKAEIQGELDVAIAKADAEIAAKAAESEVAIGEIRKGALKAVEAVAKTTTGEIIKSVMPGAGDAKAVTAAVKAQLKEA